MSDQILKQLLLSSEEAPPSTVWDQIDMQLTQVNEDLAFKSKIDLFEEEAPVQAWENIQSELTIMEADRPLQIKVSNLEETAPVTSWDAIEQKLNDLEFSDKVNSIAEGIPETVWPRIEDELAFIETDKLVAEKIQTAEEDVPVTIWNKIESALDGNQSQPAISIQRNYSAFYKLAAAAIITGILFWGGYNILFTTSTNSTVAINKETPLPETNPSSKNAVAEPERKPQKDVAFVQNTISKKIKTQPAASLIAATIQLHTQANTIEATDLHHKKVKQPTSTNNFDEDNYLIVINDDGDLIRVSKKLTQMKCAQNNSELPVDAVTALESKNCDNQIKSWQHKIATSQISGILDAREIINITEK